MNWIEAEKERIFQTYSRQPLLLVKGKGAWVWDDRGRKYLDFFSGLGVNNLGHCHPAVARAVSAQVKTLIHTCNLYYTRPQIDCAQALVERTFPGRVFFCNSGAEANECALKIARRWGKKFRGPDACEVISFENSFHGRTLGTVSLTGQEKYRKGFDPLVEKVVYAQMNDWPSVESRVTEKTAAIFIEPIQGEGGIVPAERDFLKKLRAFCDAEKILLVFDEVQCGLGRTGKLFAYQDYGVTPDVLCLAKGLGGGLPIGACIANETAAGMLGKGDHASTFGGNPVVCSAALQVLKAISPALLRSVEKKSASLFRGLERLRSKYPGLITQVRGVGFMAGIVLRRPGAAVVDLCRDSGLLINCTQETVLRLLPPLIASDREVRRALAILDRVLERFSRIK